MAEKQLYFFKFIGDLRDCRIVVVAKSRRNANKLALEIAQKDRGFRDKSDLGFLSVNPIPKDEEFGILLDSIY